MADTFLRASDQLLLVVAIPQEQLPEPQSGQGSKACKHTKNNVFIMLSGRASVPSEVQVNSSTKCHSFEDPVAGSGVDRTDRSVEP